MLIFLAKFKYLKNERNLGIALSHNKLIDMAKGDYLAIFNHDDISLPTRLEKEVKFLDENPDVGVVGTRSKNIIAKKTNHVPLNDHEIKLTLMRGCAIVHSSSMIRKSVLIKNNIRYENKFSPAEDYALWCRLIPYTKFHNIEEILFYYRDHHNNTSHRQKKQMQQASFAIWAFVKTENPALYNEFLLKAKHTMRINLFGIIPFLKIIKKGNRSKVYLFEKIPLFSCKSVIKLQDI